MNTSGHRQLDADQRRGLFDGIATLLDEGFGGELIEERNAVLYLARTTGEPVPVD